MRKYLLTALPVLLGAPFAVAAQVPSDGIVVVEFAESATTTLSGADRFFVRSTADEVVTSVRELFPDFEDGVRVSVGVGDRDLDAVGGVTGSADAPGQIQIWISSTFPGGAGSATRAGLQSTLLHEVHHLVRGWTIRENRFGPGIPTAIVNEGLAAVFADTYSDRTFEGYEYPDDVAIWLDEILSLPLDANYNTWMNVHPDGRLAIGYRTGRYVVHEAIRRSGYSILELSALPPQQILELAID